MSGGLFDHIRAQGRANIESRDFTHMLRRVVPQDFSPFGRIR